MNTVLMLAGGVGTRMGANIPKQFIRIKGKPIIAYTLDVLEKNQSIDAVEIVCVHGFEDMLTQIIDEYGFQKVRWICEGGPTFSLSVYNGLKNLRNTLEPDDLVMIHMSVSPFAGDEMQPSFFVRPPLPDLHAQIRRHPQGFCLSVPGFKHKDMLRPPGIVPLDPERL